jgi:pimeloyl-ACP methyl ester carboxylesterase
VALNGDPAGSIDLGECMESLRCPTLVIRGAESNFLPVQTCTEMARRQPLLQWVEVADSGHYVHDDNPRAVIELVREFLA